MGKKNPPASVTAARPQGRRHTPPETSRVTPGPTRTAAKPFQPLTPLTFLRPIASLKLTVVLMLMSMVLVYTGTIAQVYQGIWQVVDQYFWSSFVYIPLKNFIPGFLAPKGFTIPTLFGYEIGIPFVGGKLLGFMLLVNLLAAHTVRFKLSWKRSGIWLIHGGLILLLVGEGVTRAFAQEYHMDILEGTSRNYIADHREVELAFFDISDPDTDRVVVVQAKSFKLGKRVSDPRLPVDFEVVSYMENSALLEKPPLKNLATRGVGLSEWVTETPVVTGTDPDQRVDAPAAYIKLFDRESGESIGVYLTTIHLRTEQRFDAAGKPYKFALRPRRTYLPYTMQLKKFTHDVYEGTEKPKDFRSHLLLSDQETNTQRYIEVYMNTPLRYRGKTYYQSGVQNARDGRLTGTILQVVDNPGAVVPYVSCILVSLGMFVHFGINLTQFMRRKLNGSGVQS